MARPLKIIDLNYDKIHKRSLVSKVLTLVEIKNIISED